MSDARNYATRMMALFEGYAGAHGTHGTTEHNAAKGGKNEIKKTARTVRDPVSVELWEKHLLGTQALGIIPIREDGMCLWGCIDVDEYDLNLGEVVKKIAQRRLPIVVCRTKSGGAHLFLFLHTPAPAEEMRSRLRQMAASLGWGTSEIFPKQNQILSDRGDLGNWLNMPYLDFSQTKRYGVKESGGGMDIAEFLAYAEGKRTSIHEIAEPDTPQDESLDDGPPCLQHLTVVGFPEGTRNNGLFGLGTFCKKKFPGRWKEVLEEYNRKYMTPPLPAEEVIQTINNLEKKDYEYKCKDVPMMSYCNSTLCRTRKFGVGGAGKYPTISGISKLDAGEDTLWFVDVEDVRLELTTEQLQNYRMFQKVAMEQLTMYFLPMKAETWAAMVGEAMTNATIIEPTPEITAIGHFLELLGQFVTDRHRGLKKEELLLGKPWQDESTGRHYFRLQDLMRFLDRAQFRRWGRNMVARRLEQEKQDGKNIGGHGFFNIDGNGINVYYVEDIFKRQKDVPLRDLPDDAV